MTFAMRLVSLPSTFILMSSLITGVSTSDIASHAHNLQDYLATTIITETLYTACGPPSSSKLSSLCTTSTDLVLPNNGVLSGITVHPPSSPTSCYSLPIPATSLNMVAYQTNDDEFSDSESGTSSAQDPLFFYMGHNATSPQYVGIMVNGSRTLLDLSTVAEQSGHIALSLPGNQALVIDNDGLHLYHNGCTSVSSLSIANFTHQLVSIGKMPTTAIAPPCRRGLIVKRDVQEVNFTVQVAMNKSVDANAPQPNLTFGASPCDFLQRVSLNDSDICSWTCQTPGEFSEEKRCERSFHSWMNGTSGSIIPSPKNVSNLLDYMTPFLQHTGASIEKVFPALTPVLDKVVPFLGRTQKAVADTIDFGGMAMCKLLHQHDESNLVMQGAGLPSAYTVGAFVTPPASTISGNLIKPTASPTKEPPRLVLPGQSGFPTISALSFVPLPTLSILGLTIRDAGDVNTALGSQVDEVSAM